MVRFVVTRQYVKHKGILYKKGELLPPNFTERDRCRNIYPSRIGTIEVAEEVKAEEPEKVTEVKAATPVKGAISAAKTVNGGKPITGTHAPVRALSSK